MNELDYKSLLDATENICYCRNIEIATVVATFGEKRQ